MDEFKKMTNRHLVQSYAVEVLNLQYRIERRNAAFADPDNSEEYGAIAQEKLDAQQEKNKAFEAEIIRRMK